jgi:predicted dehydrogenase
MRDWETIDVKRIEGAVETRVYPLIDIERAELEAFAAAAAGGNPYPVTLEEAVHGIAVFEAVTKSVEGDGEQVEVA